MRALTCGAVVVVQEIFGVNQVMRDIADGKCDEIPESAFFYVGTIEEAVDLSGTLAASMNRKIYVAGGLFLAIEYATIARGGRARDLSFF